MLLECSALQFSGARMRTCLPHCALKMFIVASRPAWRLPFHLRMRVITHWIPKVNAHRSIPGSCIWIQM